MASSVSPKATSVATSPKATSPRATSPKASQVEEMDLSLVSWLMNTHSVLHWPLTILSVVGLLVLGAFIEIAPRKSLEFLDNSFGRALFFLLPFAIAILIDWPTGLLAATVSLIIFARLQKQDTSEGFSDAVSEKTTQFISNPHRWFIERVLGERPLAISSDRVSTSVIKDTDIHTSSSASSTTINPLSPMSSFSQK